MNGKQSDSYGERVRETMDRTFNEFIDLLPGDLHYCLEERVRW